ncbi:MAG TPA: DUF1559 domain-containing protein [Pirellulales bacterium]
MHARCTCYAKALILILLAAGCTERAALAAEKTDGPAAVDGEPAWRRKPDPATSAVVRKLLDLNGAMWDYKKAHQRFPSAATHGKDGQPLLSWRVELLPYLGEKELYDQFHHDEPWDSEHNKTLLEKMPEAFHSPRVSDLAGKTVFLVPTGVETMFFDDQGTTEEQITDGLDQTISIVEVAAEHAVPWTKPADFPVDKQKPDAGLARDRAGALTVAKASLVSTLPRETDAATLWGLFTRAGGEEIDLPWGSSDSGFFTETEEDDPDVDHARGKAKEVVTVTKEDPATDAVQNKLLNLEQAMVKYLTVHQRFPPAATHGKDGQPLLSWRVELLPYLDEMDLYLRFRHDEPWDSKHNKRLLKKMPAAFQNPRVGDLDGKTVFLVPTGKETMYFDDKGITPEQIADGTDKTISMVEVDAEHAVPWTKPADFPVDKTKPDAGLARDRAGTLSVAEACSMAVTLPAGTDAATLWSLFTRAGGENIDLPAGASEAGMGAAEEDSDVLDDIDRAGGNIGTPAEVVAEFKSSQEPLPPGIEEKVGEKLHRIALALKDATGPNELCAPTAICDNGGKPLLSWRVKMLPYLDEKDLYDQFHLDEPWDSPHNLPLLKKMPYVYLHPKVGRLEGKTVFLRPIHQRMDYTADANGKVREILFGVSSTIPVVVADAEHAAPWTKPDDLILDDASPTRGLERWPDHFLMMALADAQILLLPDNVEPTKLEGFFTRAGMSYVPAPPAPDKNPQ